MFILLFIAVVIVLVAMGNSQPNRHTIVETDYRGRTVKVVGSYQTKSEAEFVKGMTTRNTLGGKISIISK